MELITGKEFECALGTWRLIGMYEKGMSSTIPELPHYWRLEARVHPFLILFIFNTVFQTCLIRYACYGTHAHALVDTFFSQQIVSIRACVPYATCIPNWKAPY